MHLSWCWVPPTAEWVSYLLGDGWIFYFYSAVFARIQAVALHGFEKSSALKFTNCAAA